MNSDIDIHKIEKSVPMGTLKTFLNSPYSTHTRWKMQMIDYL